MEDLKIKSKYLKLCYQFRAFIRYMVCLLQTRLSKITNKSVNQITWPSIYSKTRGQTLETLRRIVKTRRRVFEGFREDWRLDGEFKKLDRVFEKLGCMFLL